MVEQEAVARPRAPADVLDSLQAMIEIGHVRGAEQLLDQIDVKGNPLGGGQVERFVKEARLHLSDVDLVSLRSLILEARHDG